MNQRLALGHVTPPPHLPLDPGTGDLDVVWGPGAPRDAANGPKKGDPHLGIE